MHRLERLWHLVLVIISLCITNCAGCKVLVTQTAISKSWQSSSYHKSDGSPMCGFGSSSISTAVGIASADQGYHWIVVQLMQPMLIADVTMKSAGQTGSSEDRMSQAEDIEVWTSSQVVDFGSETCSSTQIGSKFTSKMGIWVMCGKTGKVDRAKGNVKTQCNSDTNHMAHMVLLRKNVSNISIPDRQCMSFSQLHLIARPVVTFAIEPSNQVLQNSNVTMSCNVTQCADGTVNISIHHSNENSVKASKMTSMKHEIISYHIANVKPSHSGTYTCVVGDKVLSAVELNVILSYKAIAVIVSTFLLVAIVATIIFSKQRRPSQLRLNQPAILSADPIPLLSRETTEPLKSMGDDLPPQLPQRTQSNDGSAVDHDFGAASTYSTVMAAAATPKHFHAGKANPESDDEAARLCCKAGSEITVYLEILADGPLEVE